MNDFPSFSPDDNKIVFSQIGQNGNKLYIRDINGQDSIEIADDSYSAAYWVNESIYYISKNNKKYQIQKYNVEKETKNIIYENSKRISSPLVLSDESILFFHLEDGNIYSLNIDGTGDESLVTDSQKINSKSLTLSPCETKLAFIYDDKEIYYINLDDIYPKSANDFNKIISENYHKNPQEPNWF